MLHSVFNRCVCNLVQTRPGARGSARFARIIYLAEYRVVTGGLRHPRGPARPALGCIRARSVQARARLTARPRPRLPAASLAGRARMSVCATAQIILNALSRSITRGQCTGAFVPQLSMPLCGALHPEPQRMLRHRAGNTHFALCGGLRRSCLARLRHGKTHSPMLSQVALIAHGRNLDAIWVLTSDSS